MAISREEVEHIAELAKLALTEEEKTLYAEQLSAILEYFRQLQEVDTSGIPPTATVLPIRNVFRPDEPGEPMSREELLRNAPAQADGCFQVQPILEFD
ncbi:Asp-tRNA(Asn)/Glu-tRNA(Gln) amidotransferase subunit GatC [Thermoflexus hugenholtzii]|jgi:aspartyl/glutamyl-tRNA(Asn/Gln) amidotransferase subunit C (EC 6.3.5.-)|uniref:Aspartyl/glutamyl-tRNA(Asn/Gln) amidotransferase subunit C n=1 Tax=Thermoflexus hugenholtzii JAD2 TaxID=877466 RepID=A0A212QQW3_9CHLR|nr:Asp-tRNA(Asn)/Glu-tRNA(Gln) amidotransferase subunit GatC [Thermoflexus hugenholtzii]SNB61928.1 aspartyl/glutamyl-tRNA(Asn/Gln) amidotransferase subunit C [Thermoflexus hugenholtzii JAD2]